MKRFFLKKHRGYTIIELLVVLGIIAIGTLIATPNIIDWMKNNRIKAVTRDLVSNFQRAKMEAIKRNANVVLSFTTGANGWYEIFVDDGAGGGIAENFVRDGAEVRIVAAGQSESAIGVVNMPDSVTLFSANFSGSSQQAGFNPQGLPAEGRTGTVNFRKTDDSNRQFEVTLSVAGNVSTRFTSDGGTSWE